jgi:ZIP family zinc transporter
MTSLWSLPPTGVLVVAGLATGLATLAGGLLALGFKSRTQAILGFSAGAVVAVALVELLPEALKTATNPTAVADIVLAAALGLLCYLGVERGLGGIVGRASAYRGHLGAGSLTLHSAVDGMVIGLAFQASTAIGLSVAVAIMAHDLSDGVNTVNLSLGGGTGSSAARRWLAADALAPMFGIVLARIAPIPRPLLPTLLAWMAGALLYVGVSRLISREYASQSRSWAALGPLVGFGFICFVARGAHV